MGLKHLIHRIWHGPVTYLDRDGTAASQHDFERAGTERLVVIQIQNGFVVMDREPGGYSSIKEGSAVFCSSPEHVASEVTKILVTRKLTK